MQYHNITKDDMKNGPGLRTVLWVAGCTHACPGCHNEMTWDPNGGLPFDTAAKTELLDAIGAAHCAGVTFSGGDPLHPQNRDEIGKIISDVKKRYSCKSIWLYTGYQWGEVCALPFIGQIDVLVDGQFDQKRTNAKLHWCGSANQRIIDVQRTLANEQITLYTE